MCSRAKTSLFSRASPLTSSWLSNEIFTVRLHGFLGVRRRPVAKRHATRKAPVRAAARKVPAKAQGLRIAGVGSAAVLKATGRAWEDWLKVLDRAGARKMEHKEIALMLSRKFSVPNWWSQMVSVGYEQARGLRKVHEKANGFSASASRTIGISVEKLFSAWSDPRHNYEQPGTAR